MVVTKVVRTKKFESSVKGVKDRGLKNKIKKQIAKIIGNPRAGKPLKFDLKGERVVRIKPYRLIYAVKGETLYLLRFEHRKKIYR